MFPGDFGPDCKRIVTEVQSIFTAGAKIGQDAVGKARGIIFAAV